MSGDCMYILSRGEVKLLKGQEVVGESEARLGERLLNCAFGGGLKAS